MMKFFLKDEPKRSKTDIERIKEAVKEHEEESAPKVKSYADAYNEAKHDTENDYARISDYDDIEEFHDINEEEQPSDAEDYDIEDAPRPSVRRVEPHEFKGPVIEAPLFVKVDKYNEILSNLREIKELVAGLRKVFPILIEVDDVRKEAIESLRISLQKIEKKTAELDAEILRPGEARMEIKQPKEVLEIGNYLDDLQGQLSDLKGELKKCS